MKKRVKLLTTIASLCLAVALMAFGVYAATSVSFNTTSTVTFGATEIQGKWQMKIEGGDYTGKKYSNWTDVEGTITSNENNGAALNVSEVVPIDEIKLTLNEEGKATVVYSFRFVLADGAQKDVKITVTPTVDEDDTATDGYSLDSEEAKTNTSDYNNAETADMDAEVSFTLTLDRAEADFNSAKNSDWTVSFNALAEPNA